MAGTEFLENVRGYARSRFREGSVLHEYGTRKLWGSKVQEARNREHDFEYEQPSIGAAAQDFFDQHTVGTRTKINQERAEHENDTPDCPKQRFDRPL